MKSNFNLLLILIMFFPINVIFSINPVDSSETIFKIAPFDSNTEAINYLNNNKILLSEKHKLKIIKKNIFRLHYYSFQSKKRKFDVDLFFDIVGIIGILGFLTGAFGILSILIFNPMRRNTPIWIVIALLGGLLLYGIWGIHQLFPGGGPKKDKKIKPVKEKKIRLPKEKKGVID